MSVKIHTEAEWQRDAVAVWVWRTVGAGRQVLRLKPVDWTSTIGELLEWEDVGELEANTPATIILPVDVLGALAAAAADHAPPSSAQAAHLADAIGIRDELLELVKRTFPPPAIPLPPPAGGPTGVA